MNLLSSNILIAGLTPIMRSPSAGEELRVAGSQTSFKLPDATVYTTKENFPLLAISQGESAARSFVALRTLNWNALPQNGQFSDGFIAPYEFVAACNYAGRSPLGVIDQWSKFANSAGIRIDDTFQPEILRHALNYTSSDKRSSHSMQLNSEKLASLETEDVRHNWHLLFEAFLQTRYDPYSFAFLADHAAGKLQLHSWEAKLDARRYMMETHESCLVRLIKNSGGLLPFDIYFNAAMFSAFGTYNLVPAKDLIQTEESDMHVDGKFVTLSRYTGFAEVVLNEIMNEWQMSGKPTEYNFVEAGCGTGTLAENILTELERRAANSSEYRQLKDALSYHMVEKSRTLHEAQQQRLKRFNSVRFYNIDAVNGQLPKLGRGIFFSLELLDMLPIKSVVAKDGFLWESFMTEVDDVIQEVLVRPTEQTLQYLHRHPEALSVISGRFYFRPSIDKFFKNVCTCIEGGVHMMLDYYAGQDRIADNAASGFRTFPTLLREEFWWMILSNVMNSDINALDISPTYLACGPRDWTGDVDIDAVMNSAFRIFRRVPSIRDVYSVRDSGSLLPNGELKRTFKISSIADEAVAVKPMTNSYISILRHEI